MRWEIQEIIYKVQITEKCSRKLRKIDICILLFWKTNSGKRDGLREIYHQKFTNPHSSEVTNQMHSWVLSLNETILLILLIFFCCILPVTLLKSISSAPYIKIFQSLSNWFDWFIFSNCRIKNIPVDLLRVNILKSV